MWDFGPDKVWIDKEQLFIRTPRIQDDWPIRDYRKVMLNFRGKTYAPIKSQQQGKHVLYEFIPFDPSLDLPGTSLNYDEAYVRIREANFWRPKKMVMVIAVCVLLLGSIFWSMVSGRSSVPTGHFGGLVTADGSTFRLEELSGNYVWLDFSAPWCPPCRAQAPTMKKMEENTQGVKFVTIMISDLQSRPPVVETALDWSQKFGLDPAMVCADTDRQFSREWNVGSIPLNVLISPTGKILYRQVGSHQTTHVNQVLSKYVR